MSFENLDSYSEEDSYEEIVEGCGGCPHCQMDTLRENVSLMKDLIILLKKAQLKGLMVGVDYNDELILCEQRYDEAFLLYSLNQL